LAIGFSINTIEWEQAQDSGVKKNRLAYLLLPDPCSIFYIFLPAWHAMNE
jgi:hypothetical protein